MALNTNKREGDKLHAEEWNELAQEVQGKQPRLNIVDALDSTSSVDVLSAKQGKVLNDKIGDAKAIAQDVEAIVKTLPVGYFYGTSTTEEGLPSEISEKGYAYVGTAPDYVIYTYEPTIGWRATENKYSTPTLETNLETKSQTKAPTTKAVKEGIEAIDVTSARSSEDDNEFTKVQKYNASANINDRSADVAPITGSVNALGYKILNPNASFASQLVDANTIYEVKDEFNINGGNVNIPANCTLKFNGGKLSNGTIIGNNTTIDTTDGVIFDGVSLLGTWRNTDFYTDWWKMFSDGESDDSFVLTSIGNTINANGQGNIIFGMNKVYGVAFHSYANPGGGEELPYVIKLINVNNVVVDLNGSSLKVIQTDEVLSKTIGGVTKTFTNDQLQGYSIIASHSSSVIIKNGTIEGDRITHDYNAPAPKYQNNNWTWAVKGSNEWGYGVYGVGGILELDKVVIFNMIGDSVYIRDYYQDGALVVAMNFSASNCEFHHNRRQGVSSACAESIKIKDCNIHHIGSHDSIDGAAPKSGIDLENDPNRQFGNVVIQGTTITNCDGGSIIYGSSSSKADKIIIDGCNITDRIIMLYPSELRTQITNSTISDSTLKYVDISNCTLNLVGDSYFGDVKITNSNINYIDYEADLWVIGNVDFKKCTINGIYRNTSSDVSISSDVGSSSQVNEYEVHFTDCYINSLAFGNEYTAKHVLRYYITNSTLEECQLYTTPLSLHDFPYTYIYINNCQLINSVQYIATSCPMEINNSIITFEYKSIMGGRHWLGESATINDSVINVDQSGQAVSSWSVTKARFTAKNTIAKIKYPTDSTWKDKLQDVNVVDSQINVMRGTVPLTLDIFEGIQKNTTFNKGIAVMSHPPLGEGNIGYMLFNSTLNKPIFWTGNAWVDSNSDYIVDNSGSLQNRLALTSPVKGQQFKLTGGANDIYLIYVSYGWFKATDGTPWYDDRGTLNAMYDKYNYTLLTAEPSTWATTYNTYYKIVDGVYTKLTTLETWAEDTYYKKDVNVNKGIQIKLIDDDTELNDKVVKWNGTKYINIVDNVALKAGTPIVTFTTENNTTTAAITSTSSGKIYYTKDGSTPTSSSTEYSSAITLADGDQVQAICIRDHVDNSNIGFVKVATPVIAFSSTGILTITCDTPDVKIYYTIDGSTPTTSSTQYDSSASVTIAKNVTVKAFAVLIGRVNSEIASKKRS